MSNATVQPALTYLQDHWDEMTDKLVEISRIPSVSAEGYPREELTRCADQLGRYLEEAGIQPVEMLRIGDSAPYVFGEWHGADGAPTLLLYGHYDVQPPGDPEKWESPAFEPTIRDNGRMYGRGVVDDKAGIMVHIAAVAAYLKTAGRLPVNVKFLLEGEEEAGSSHLEDLLHTYRDKLMSDVIVLTDTSNLETGLPSLTYTLRGMVAVELEVRSLTQPQHSGTWGGPLPDAAMALSKILARLLDDEGRIAIPGIYDRVRKLTDEERREIEAMPFDEAQYRADGGMLEGVELAGEQDRSIYERLWTRPSLAVTAMEASDLATASNQIIASARARVGIRIVPHMEPEEVTRMLMDFLTQDPPWGVQVSVKPRSPASWWLTDPTGPAFAAAERALEQGYGRKVAYIGCGGSIPFVQPFSDAFGGAPALLVGVEDPVCNAHSENESVSMDDWNKATRSAIHLYAELANYRG